MRDTSLACLVRALVLALVGWTTTSCGPRPEGSDPAPSVSAVGAMSPTLETPEPAMMPTIAATAATSSPPAATSPAAASATTSAPVSSSPAPATTTAIPDPPAAAAASDAGVPSMADELFVAAQDAIARNCAGTSCHDNANLAGFTPDSPREVLEMRARSIAAAVYYYRMPLGDNELSEEDRNAIVDWYFALPDAVERPD